MGYGAGVQEIAVPLLQGLMKRVRSRLGGADGGGIGSAFNAEREKEWDELPEQVDAALKKIGSAIVGSWEVGAAELGRVVIGRPDSQTLIDRYSDSLVPTLAPYQDLHKKCNDAMRDAKKAALKSRRLEDAAGPLLKLVAGVGLKAGEGWGKTTDYLEPIFALCPDPAAARAHFAEGKGMLQESAVRAEGVLRERLAALPQSKTLWDGICDAFDAYQAALSRDLEIGLDVRTRALVMSARAGIR